MANTKIYMLTIILIIIFVLHQGNGMRCPPLEIDLKNGQLIKESSSPTRIKVRLACDEGYFPAGKDYTVCEKGKWSRQLPECIRMENRCPPPPQIENGKAYGTQRHKNAIVSYVCDEGYFLVGESQLVCMWSYEWNHKPPVCQAEEESIGNLASRFNSEFLTKMVASSEDGRGRIIGSEVKDIGLDLVLLIDRSSSIDPRDFKIGLKFLEFLFNHFQVNNGNANENSAHFALITFGDEAQLHVNLNNSTINSTEKACEVLRNLQAGGGGTAMVSAFVMTWTDVNPLLRPKAKKAIFLMTDGKVNINVKDPNAINPENFAENLRSEVVGFEIFVVGVGNDINKTQLALIASEPSNTHVFYLNEYDDFEKVLWLIQNHPTPAPPPGPEKCGYIPPRPNKKSENDIVHDWPWLVSIHVTNYQENNDTDVHFCSGVLICEDWILTAASCLLTIDNIKDQFVSIYLGEYDITKQEDNDLVLYAENITFHPDFDVTKSKDHNLALLKLNKEVPLNGRYRPICVPQEKQFSRLIFGTTGTTEIAGWGTSPIMVNDSYVPLALESQLKSSAVKFDDDQAKCHAQLQHYGFNDTLRIFCTKSNFDDSNFDESCLGNLGAPVVFMNEHRNSTMLLGVLIWRDQCSNGFNAFVDITYYYDWINNVTQFCQGKHAMDH